MDTVLGPFTNDSQITSAGNQHHLIFDRTNQRLDLHAAGALRVLTGLTGSSDPATGNDLGSERLRVTAAGTVGIGTTGPARPLHVSNPGNDLFLLQSTRGGGGNSANLDFQTYATIDQVHPTASIRAIDDGVYSSHMALFTKDRGANTNGMSERLRITSDGNVGIGTLGPVTKLQVAGDLALHAMPSGAARPLPAGSTMIWNDGGWLRLNQNLDYSKPVFGVCTPGLFAPNSLNVGGMNNYADPGGGNVLIAGNVTTVGNLSWGGDRSESGYVTIGKLQICWGTGSFWVNKPETDIRVNFPQSFRSTPAITVSIDDPGWGVSTLQGSVGAYQPDNAGFTILFKYNGNRQYTETYFWIAIGLHS